MRVFLTYLNELRKLSLNGRKKTEDREAGVDQKKMKTSYNGGDKHFFLNFLKMHMLGLNAALL